MGALGQPVSWAPSTAPWLRTLLLPGFHPGYPPKTMSCLCKPQSAQFGCHRHPLEQLRVPSDTAMLLSTSSPEWSSPPLPLPGRTSNAGTGFLWLLLRSSTPQPARTSDELCDGFHRCWSAKRLRTCSRSGREGRVARRHRALTQHQRGPAGDPRLQALVKDLVQKHDGFTER